MARPAASSAPVLILEPDDNWYRVFCSDACVMDNWFCAARDDTLFRTLNISSSFWFPPATEPCGTLFESPLRLFRRCFCIGPVYRHCEFPSSTELTNFRNSYPVI